MAIDKQTVSMEKSIMEEKTYWLNKFSEKIINNFFPCDEKYDFDIVSPKEVYLFEFPRDLNDKLIKLSNHSDNNLFLILLTAVGVLFNKYTGNNKPVLLSPIFKQNTEQNFLNTLLLLKMELDKDSCFKDLLMSLKNELQESTINVNYPLSRLPYLFESTSDDEDSSFFDTAVILENVHDLKYLNEVEPKVIFSFKRNNNKIVASIIYRSKLYGNETVKNIAKRLIILLNKMSANLSLEISKIDMLTEKEKDEIFNIFNSTDTGFPYDKTIIEVFEEQVKRFPYNTAVIYKESRISYLELNQKANQLGRLLRKNGMAPETIAAIMIEPSTERMIALFAVLKAGGAYLPVDTEFPDDRIRFMLKDSQSRVLITQQKFQDKVLFKGKTVFIDDTESFNETSENFKISGKKSNLIYLIYTSGSTGDPKGVMITNKNLINYAYWSINTLNIKESDRTILASSFAFDLGNTAIFSSLLCGAELHLLDKESYYDIENFIDYIAGNSITFLKLTPSLFSLIINHPALNSEKLQSISLIVLGGEPVNPLEVEKFHHLVPSARVMNHYGPTETTIGCITKFIDFNNFKAFKAKPVIGKPIYNMKAFVMDGSQQILPVGFSGELCLSGAGLARGYMNNENLDKEKFVVNPYQPDERLYRTGDLARWLDDGSIEFLGRIDNQIKIRGYRIEPDEIKQILFEYDKIQDAVIAPIYDNNKANGLAAYIVFKEEASGDENDFLLIKEYLAKKLPIYMIPTRFMAVDCIPMSKNGKTDYKALYKLKFKKRKEARKNTIITGTEQKLLQIWCQVLDNDDIDIDDNFFELGGHSISMIQSINRIRKELSSNIGLADFFEHSTIRKLGQIIDQSGKYNDDKNRLVNKKEQKQRYHISPIQYPEWYLQKMNPESTFYNQNYIVEIKGRLNIPAFIESMNILIQRHDALRISFTEIEGKPYQVLHEKINPVGMDHIIDIRDCKDKEPEIKKIIDLDYGRVFDFSKAPIFRIKLIQVADRKAIFVFNTHHIIWDQLSSFIFFKELSLYYNALCENREIRISETGINYIDYTEWLNNLIDQKLLDDQRQYWLNRFSTIPEPLNFATDHIRPPIQAFKGIRLFKQVKPESCDAVENFCKKFNITKQIFFLTVLNMLIYRYTGQKDFVVGTPIANRDKKEFEQLIGLFAAALPIRCNINEKHTFLDLMNHTREVSIAAYDNHLYPFNKVLEELKLNVDFSRSKIISVFFGVQNDETELYDIQLKDLVTKPYQMEYENYTTAFDFTLQINHSSSYINFSFRYDTEIFTGKTGQRFFDKYVYLFEKCIENPELDINSYPLCDTFDEKIIHGIVNQTSYFDIPDVGLADILASNINKYPHNIAVIDKDSKYTFRILMEKSNQFANYLVAKGIKKGDKVAVLMASSFEMIVVLLGIIKTGAAYVPLHHEYSASRIEEITTLINCTLMIMTSGYGTPDIHEKQNQSVIYYEKEFTGINKQSVENPRVIVGANDTAYIIFTSGSTGKPKGIEILHRGIVNLLHSIQKNYQLDTSDTILFHTPLVFDASILDIFLPLFSGSKIVIVEDNKRKNILDIAQYIDRYSVTFVQFVPLMLDSLINIKLSSDENKLDSLKHVIVGAAILNRTLKDKFFNHFECKLLNHYGPTEITVDAAFYDCSNSSEADIIPVGRPICNTKLYILDPYSNLCPIGVPGELYISSAGIARGYVGLPELNAEKFVLNPFDDGICSNLFKTGDRAIYTEDGNITILGRLDNQVKVNGNRVELEEIEGQLLANPYIKNAAVEFYRNGGSSDKIVGFVELEESINTITAGNKMKYRLYTLDQNRSLRNSFDLIHHKSWPKYFEGSQILHEYWNKLYRVFPEYQLILMNEEERVAAIGNSIPIYWDGNVDTLPAGWDSIIETGFKDFENKSCPNTMVMIAAVVDHDYKGRQLSQHLIDSFKSFAEEIHFEHLLVILRPIGKIKYQQMKLEEYAELNNDSGMKIDKWLQLHIDKGAIVLKCEHDSQKITGSLAQWQEWEGQVIDSSETMCFEDTLQPVRFDKENNIGFYVDPGIWLEHNITSHGMNFKKVSEDYLKKYLGGFLPNYMIPNNIFVLNQIPRLPSGKNDLEELKKIRLSYVARDMILPQNQLQKQVFNIIKEILNIEKFGIYDSFFEIGGHSILALILLSKVEHIFGVKIPVVELLKNPTVYDLTNYLNNYNSIQNDDSEIITLSNSGRLNALCIPSLTTSPIEFVGIANAFPKLNVHVLNIMMDDFDSEEINIDRILNHYLDCISSKIVRYPIAIIGYSIGSILAFEIAKKLEDKGIALKHLIIIDARPNTEENPLFHSNFPDENLLKRHPDYQLLDRFSNQQKEKLIKRICAYFNLNSRIVNNGKLNTPISVLSNESDNEEVYADWSRLSNNNFKVYKGKGNHYELIDEKFIKKNEPIIRKIISKCME